MTPTGELIRLGIAAKQLLSDDAIKAALSKMEASATEAMIDASTDAERLHRQCDVQAVRRLSKQLSVMAAKAAELQAKQED